MIALLLLSIVPMPDGIVREHTACIEVNKYYDGNGEINFTQVICWDRQFGSGQTMHVNYWHLSTENASGVRVDIPGYAPVGKEMLWTDKSGVLRKVTTDVVHESHTQVDPEVLDRDKWPTEWRRGLRKSR